MRGMVSQASGFKIELSNTPDAERLFSTYVDDIKERNPDTKVIINSMDTSYNDFRGMGGVFDMLFATDNDSDDIHEFNKDTGAVLRTGMTGTERMDRGCGGTLDRLYAYNSYADDLYEISIFYLSAKIQTIEYTTEFGVGGVNGRLYKTLSGVIHETSEDNPLTSINSITPTYEPNGIGGLYSRLYYTSTNDNKIVEINPSTLAQISEAAATTSYSVGGTTLPPKYATIPKLVKGETMLSKIVYNNEDYNILDI